MAGLDPTLFTGTDPFSNILDKFVQKLSMTTDPFGAKYLNEWCDDEDRGGLKLITFDGTQPVDYEPERSKTPAIVVYGAEGPPIEPRGEGDRRITYSLAFEGWIYTRDQREGNAFMWRALTAIFFPWMQAPCPIAPLDWVHSYFPAETIAPRPFIRERGKHPFVWEIVVNVMLAGSTLPFLRGM